MKTDSAEYLPAQEEHKPVFRLAPVQDDITFKVIGTRLDVLRDKELSKGAKLLFVLLLDFSMNPYTYVMRGVVAVSVTKLSENLNCCRRSIFEWTRQLLVKRFLWVSKQFMPNFWALNTYHISVLDPEDQPAQLPTRDGLWGNGARRPQSPPGEGARRGGCKNVHASPSNDFSNLPENTPQACTQMHAPVAFAATDRSNDCDGASQPLRRAIAKSATGSRKKVHASGAPECTAPSQKGAHFNQSQIETESQKAPLSCLTAEAKSEQLSGSTARKGVDLQREREFLERLGMITGPKEIANWGGRWRNRFREDPKKAERVLAELSAMRRENRIVRNAGACADDLWKRFV